jgi:hypothetical protein
MKVILYERRVYRKVGTLRGGYLEDKGTAERNKV